VKVVLRGEDTHSFIDHTHAGPEESGEILLGTIQPKSLFQGFLHILESDNALRRHYIIVQEISNLLVVFFKFNGPFFNFA
jgi:hypothetical protein